MSLLRWGFCVLPLAGLGAAAVTGAQGSTAPVPASALKACAAIGTAAERLACYDQLAGRAPASAAAAPAPAAAAPAPATQAPAPAAQAPAPAAQAPAPAAAPPKESFGLYAAEHPAAPTPAASYAAKVTGLGVSASGHPTVALEGGQLWELDGPDPLLANGTSVSIKRAALGSFLMTTPDGRTHRVHRLR